MSVLEKENSLLKNQLEILTSVNEEVERDYREIEGRNDFLEQEITRLIKEKQMMEKFCSDSFLRTTQLTDEISNLKMKNRVGRKMRDYLTARLRFAIVLLSSVKIDFKQSFKAGDLIKIK